ncbi:MAG: FesM [Phototrophicales bacterium]|nr:MAG: FesM [Phototrophicales bacterium]
MIDVLRLPLIGRILKRRRGRLVLQIPFLLIALLLIYDGFTGTPLAAQNLATIVSWVHFRGFAILALLLAGNLFCMGCPFTLPRTLAKRLSLSGRRFPRFLRGKWLSIGALLLLFFLYEWLDLWASPALTAWVIVAYFAASFVLEALFSESAFCKYVCPLGAFNFVYSTAAPTRIGVHDADVCKSCVGKECLNGSYSPQPVILIDRIGVDGAPDRTHTHDKTGVPGCGTLLFAPQIQSNLDCTLCLDCARACPHDNVGLFTRAPGAELTQPDAWHKRFDLAFLVIGLAFMGLLNAFGMIPPVYALMSDLIDALGLRELGWSSLALEGVALLTIFGVGGVLLPVLLTVAAAFAARILTRTARRDSLRSALSAFAPAFVPIGAGFWLAHYSFHLWIGFFTVVPAFQAFLLDHRVGILGQPNWMLGGEPNLAIIGALQTLALLGGFIGSLSVASRIALRLYRRDSFLGLLPWALLLLALMLVGLWVFGQPMEMRGALFD